MHNNGEDRLRVYFSSFQEEITGSNTIVKVSWPDGRKANFAIDCGLFQEGDAGWNEYNNKMLPYSAESIDFLLVTHVHIDHTGRIPYLIKCGFNEKIYTSEATASLLPVMLNDSYCQMQNDFNREYLLWRKEVEKRKKRYKQKKDKQCLNYDKYKRKYKYNMKDINYSKPKMMFDKNDIAKTIRAITTIDDNETFSPFDGIEITFLPNAHINGAVVIYIRVFDNLSEDNFIITGDLGMYNTLTKIRTKIPVKIASKISTIVAESTYGYEKEIRIPESEYQKHCRILNNTLKDSGTLIYLVNALERSSRILQCLKELQEQEQSKDILKEVPIYFDTTLGLKCNAKYVKMLGTYFLPKNLISITNNEVFSVYNTKGPQIIICTSPRFTQGSFQKYAKWAIENAKCSVIFTSYVPDKIDYIVKQQEGYTFHYRFQDVEKIVKRCKMYKFKCFSAHVSPNEMDVFLNQFKNAKTILFNHGTTEGKNANKDRFETENRKTHVLLYGRTVIIEKGAIVKVF